MVQYFRGSRFGGHQSFRVRGAMDDDQLRAIAPSVFAVEKHASRSERYTYIPTIDILSGMRKQGFEVVAAVQGRCRTEGKQDFTKHMIRVRHPDYADRAELGGVAPEAVLVNSHDGTSAYQLFSGIFRSICTNSMIVMEDGATEVRVPHKGNVVDQVIEGTFTVIGESGRTLDSVREWQGITLQHDEQMILAEAAHVLRFGDADGNVDTPIQPRQLLAPRRAADNGNNIWLTHNRLQENMMAGGVQAYRPANGDRPRRLVNTRPVAAIDGNVKLNRALWMLSQRMAELKQPAMAA